MTTKLSLFFFHYRKNAIDKVKLMIDYIAYPDELLDDSKLNAYYEIVIYYLNRISLKSMENYYIL